MIRLATLFLSAILCFAGVGCLKQENQEAAVRAGILKHLSTVNGLDLNAMDMTVSNVTINGNRAQASAEFHLKGSTSPQAGMKMSYSLEKQGNAWVVTKKPDTHAPQAMPGDPLPVHPSTPQAAPQS